MPRLVLLLSLVKKVRPGYVGAVTRAVTSPPVPRGRPRILEDAAILDVALQAFATFGYDGMSIRALNKELGLSHATVNQRFGTKSLLYSAAIEHGFRSLLDDLNAEVAALDMPDDPLEELRRRFRALLVASSRHPHIGRLMNNEGLVESPRLEHIFRLYIEPAMRVTTRLMARLVDEGRIVRTSERVIFFLLVQGGSMPFTLVGLAKQFDGVNGPVEPGSLADEVANHLVRGLVHPER